MPETNSAHAPRCLPVASSQYKKDSSSNGDGEESQRQVLGNFDFLSDDGTVLITAEEFEQLQAECPSITNVRSVTRHACRTWLTGVEPERRKPRLIAWLHAKNTEMAGRKERRAATKPPSATDEDRLTERQRRFAADKEREEASARAIEFRRKQDEQRRQRQEASHDT
jgi:hypothetical protein